MNRKLTEEKIPEHMGKNKCKLKKPQHTTFTHLTINFFLRANNTHIWGGRRGRDVFTSLERGISLYISKVFKCLCIWPSKFIPKNEF